MLDYRMSIRNQNTKYLLTRYLLCYKTNGLKKPNGWQLYFPGVIAIVFHTKQSDQAPVKRMHVN